MAIELGPGPNQENLSAHGDSGVIGGRNNQSLAVVKSNFKLETTLIHKMKDGFVDLRKEIDMLAVAFRKAAAESAKIKAIGPGGKGGGLVTTKNGMPVPTDPGTGVNPFNTPKPPLPPSGGGGGGGGGGSGGGGGLSPNAMGAMAGGSMLMGSMFKMLDQRADSMGNYALGVDRMNVIFQQQYGMTQGQVMNQMRKPLANYRLGTNGINVLMGFEQQTGYKATPALAKSFEGLNAITGYTKGMSGMMQDQMSIMDPTVANRMFYMLGTNAYGMGGKLNDPLKMRQQIVQNMGLTNAAVLKGAKGPGSVTRARLTEAGVPVELQDEILTYAEENLAYKKKGGKGMYDPSNKAQRKMMGVEGNFATQREETDRLRQKRDEDYTRKQLGAYASQEKSTQQLIKAMNSLENTFSSVVGGGIQSRGWRGILGGAMKAAGAISMFVPGGQAVGMGLMFGGAALGDPNPKTGGASAATKTSTATSKGGGSDDTIMTPTYGKDKQSISQIKSRSDFKALNPKMQERLIKMFRANPNVGFGGGFRGGDAQYTMFIQRYRKTDRKDSEKQKSKTDRPWQGYWWELKNPGDLPLAVPGGSMHALGLAADLTGDLTWVQAHAREFGLEGFGSEDPPHVQPSEFAKDDAFSYKQKGAPWGLGPEGNKTYDFNTSTATGSSESGGVTSSPSAAANPFNNSSGMASFAGMTQEQIMKAMSASGAGRMGQGGTAYSAGAKAPGSNSIGDTKMTGITSPNGGGAISGVDVAKAAYKAGFRGDDLVKMIAIARRESGWRPTAYNGNLKTGDQSYGLWQLNTLNSEKGGQMGKLVNQILGKPENNTDFKELFDPETNARVAYEFYKRSGNTTRPWGGYKGMSDTKGADQYLADAQKSVKAAGLGDPNPRYIHGAPQRGDSHGNNITTITHAPVYQITVSPQISFTGIPADSDHKKIAKASVDALQEHMKTLELRNA